MVTISLDADDGQGSLDDAGTYSVSSKEECLEFMYNSWIRANVSSETYEFRISACNNAMEKFVEMGKYVVPSRTNKVDIFDVDNEDSINEFDELGFSSEHQRTYGFGEEELFWDRFDFLKNPNNHHLLIGNWLKLLNDDHDLYSLIEDLKGINEPSDQNIGDVVLASLLSFSHSHGKQIEMLTWLASKVGTDYLKNFDKYNEFAKPLLDSCERTYAEMTSATNKENYLKSFLDTWLISSIPQPELK